MKKILIFIILAFSIVIVKSQDITGTWNGVLKVQGMELGIVFHISKNGVDYSGTMDSPSQGVKGIPITSVDFNNSNLRIAIDKAQMVYNGELIGDSIKGSFRQHGMSFILNMARGEGQTEAKRPQSPVKPYPYISEDVKFENKEANITLAGTLTYPKDGNNLPAVVLISGSGAQNRDEELFGHKPFLVLSDYLTRHGIAVLRYDDRGTAESEGDFLYSTTKDFATDALAAFNYLKSRKEINPHKIGLVGHSEGGIISYMLASQNPDIAYIVSLAASTIRGDSVLLFQNEVVLRSAGMAETTIEEKKQELSKMFSLIIDVSDKTEREQKLHEMMLQSVPEDKRNNEDLRKTIDAQVNQLLSNWMRYFMSYDPATDIVNVKCPVFALNGQKDMQVDADINLGRIAALLKSNDNLTLKKYPDLNHLFQHCQTGLFSEYSQIEETISPEVMEDIVNWILKTTK